MCSDAPDMSGTNRAAEANAALSKESLDFYKSVYAEQAPERAKAAALNEQVSTAQLASMKQNDAISKDYYDYQAGTFRPMEKSIVADAQNYDTTARRDEKAAGAMADVGTQAAATQQAQARTMQRMGVNPGSAKYVGMQNEISMNEAAAKAGAASAARNQVETQGYARKMDAVNLGRNLASNQATSAGVAMNAGNSAVNNAGQTMAQANQAASMMGNGFNTAIQGNNSAGQLYSTAAQAQGKDSGVMGALGAVAGAYVGSPAGGKAIGNMFATSDKNAKEDIKPVSDEQALEAVEKTPVSNWNYKPGMADGGNHTGPMAQDVNKTMGESVAPGGKQIDLVSMNGITMASVAALSRKVDKLAKQTKGVKA